MRCQEGEAAGICFGAEVAGQTWQNPSEFICIEILYCTVCSCAYFFTFSPVSSSATTMSMFLDTLEVLPFALATLAMASVARSTWPVASSHRGLSCMRHSMGRATRKGLYDTRCRARQSRMKYAACWKKTQNIHIHLSLFNLSFIYPTSNNFERNSI